MSWAELSPEFRTIAEGEGVLTPLQLEAVKLQADGVSLRAAAQILGVKVSTYRSRLERAHEALAIEIERRREAA